MTGRIISPLAPLAAAAAVAIVVVVSSSVPMASASAATRTKNDPSASTITVTAASSSQSSAAAANKPPRCPEWITGVPVPVEHASDVCDHKSQNDPVLYRTYARDLHKSMFSGKLFAMKDEKTWVCPEYDHDEEKEGGGGAGLVEGEDYAKGHHPRIDAASADRADGGGGIKGPKTKWIVRNRASNPISVALVDTGRKDRREVSAVHPEMYPAHSDPDAVLMPGQWKAITVTLGTILHVRELVQAGAELSPGRVLVRHRPGPIAVRDTTVKPVIKPKKPPTSSANQGGGNGKKSNAGSGKRAGTGYPKDKTSSASSSSASADADDDRNLRSNATSVAAMTKQATKQVLQPILPDATPPLATRAEKEAQRGKFSYDRFCNSVNALFVNRVGKPVDVYWAGASDLSSVGAGAAGGTDRARDCDARFAFHLGVDARPHENFFESWDSYMSLENSYLGHHFVARLASNHSEVLHEIVLDRTDVGDCVSERNGPSATKTVGIKAGIEVGDRVDGNDEDEDTRKNVLVHEIVVEGYDAVVAKSSSMNLTSISL